MMQRTPPMGWNTWNTFGEEINDRLIREAADKLIETGLADAGYRYVVIDDCWALKERDENGRMVPDPEKFPNGMKALSDYVHSKGLKFGMYTCAGTLTCAGYPGSYEYEYTDAQTFADWGVDFLKYDFCFHTPILDAKYLYRRMGTALANCGREILFSACSWGEEETHEWIKTTGAHMWRSTYDIHDAWAFVKRLILEQDRLHPYNGVGCFNDMDMLIVGMGGKGNVGVKGCTFEEYRTHFTAWCLMGSPLMIGCDIRNMSRETLELLSNPEAIAINQDERCCQPYRIKSYGETGDCRVYVRMLSNGDFAIGVFNLGETDAMFAFNFDEIGVPKACGKQPVLKEIWSGKETILPNATMRLTLKPHDCSFYRCRIV